MRNISAGESETVIGLSYVLLTRLVLSTSEAGQIFRGEIMETTMQSSVLGSSIAESNSNYDVSRNDDVGDEDDEEDDYIDPDENAPVNNDVSLSNASIAIITAMRILVQNASRDTGDDHDEALEKAELTNSMIDFLITASATKLRNNLSNSSVNEQMCKTLYYEDSQSERFVSRPIAANEMSRKNYVPLPVERIWTGAQIKYLLDAIKGTYGSKPLRANGVVFQRILRRIADIAMGIRDPTSEELKGESSVYLDNPNDVLNCRIGVRLIPFFTAFGIKPPHKYTNRLSFHEEEIESEGSEYDEDNIVDDDDDDDVIDERKKISIQKMIECEWKELKQESDLDEWWNFEWPFKSDVYSLEPQSSHIYQQRRYLQEFGGLKLLLKYALERCKTPDVIKKNDSHVHLPLLPSYPNYVYASTLATQTTVEGSVEIHVSILNSLSSLLSRLQSATNQSKSSSANVSPRSSRGKRRT